MIRVRHCSLWIRGKIANSSTFTAPTFRDDPHRHVGRGRLQGLVDGKAQWTDPRVTHALETFKKTMTYLAARDLSGLV
jgi:hypothetical protein